MLAFKVKIKHTNEENTRFEQNSCPSQYWQHTKNGDLCFILHVFHRVPVNEESKQAL